MAPEVVLWALMLAALLLLCRKPLAVLTGAVVLVLAFALLQILQIALGEERR